MYKWLSLRLFISLKEIRIALGGKNKCFCLQLCEKVILWSGLINKATLLRSDMSYLDNHFNHDDNRALILENMCISLEKVVKHAV